MTGHTKLSRNKALKKLGSKSKVFTEFSIEKVSLDIMKFRELKEKPNCNSRSSILELLERTEKVWIAFKMKIKTHK